MLTNTPLDRFLNFLMLSVVMASKSFPRVSIVIILITIKDVLLSSALNQ